MVTVKQSQDRSRNHSGSGTMLIGGWLVNIKTSVPLKDTRGPAPELLTMTVLMTAGLPSWRAPAHASNLLFSSSGLSVRIAGRLQQSFFTSGTGNANTAHITPQKVAFVNASACNVTWWQCPRCSYALQPTAEVIAVHARQVVELHSARSPHGCSA